MARWASLIDRRRAERPVVLIDAGNFCYPRARRNAGFEDDFFFEGMRLLGYDAAGIGSNEIRYGRAALLERTSRAGIELLGTNIRLRGGDGVLGAPWTIVHAGGRRTLFGREGGIRVGIFSVTLAHFVYGVDRPARDLYEVVDPRLAALEAVSRLREEGCDLIVAVSVQGWEKSVDLAVQVPGIDVVINGTRSHPSAHGERVSGALVVDTGPPRSSLAEVSIVWRGGTPSASVIEQGGEARSGLERADLKELQERYERETKRRGIGIR